MTLSLRYAALSDVGRVRKDNQDSGYGGPHLLAVADGVGGAARGDIASSATIEAMRKLDVPPGNDALSELAATLHLAHDRLAEIVEQHRELDGTSTTVSAAVFDGTHLQVAHVGDSRAYLLRDGVLEQITSDHTLVQSLVDEGRITEAEARVHPHRNLILRAVDGVHEPEPDLFAIEVRTGDRLLFCSDGCSGALETEQMAALMAGEPLEDVCTRLVRSALEAGSSDNVTVVVAEVTDGQGDVAPLLVGAAALAPHRMIVSDATGNLSEADVDGLAAEPDFDPEALRYAPMAPPRRRGLRRFVALLVVLALIGGAGYGAYQYTQTRYFVSDDAGNVAIFQGVNISLPGIDLNHLVERTAIDLDDIEAFAEDVRSGKDFGSLHKARLYVAGLNPVCAESTLATTPSTPSTRAKVGLDELGLRLVTVKSFSTDGLPPPPNPVTYWTGDPALVCPGAS